MAALDGPDLPDLGQLLLQLGNAAAKVAAVGFQLRLAGAAGADAAALPGQAGSHPGQAGQEILILCQLHLESALGGFGPLRENVQNQGAPVQNGDAQNFLQNPDLGGGEGVVENCHIGLGVFGQLADFRCFAGADEGPGIRRAAVLEHFGGALTPGCLQERLQLVQGGVGRRFLLRKAICMQADENGPVYPMFLGHMVTSFHKTRKKSAPLSRCGLSKAYFRPNLLLNRSTRPPVSTSFCLPV